MKQLKNQSSIHKKNLYNHDPNMDVMTLAYSIRTSKPQPNRMKEMQMKQKQDKSGKPIHLIIIPKSSYRVYKPLIHNV